MLDLTFLTCNPATPEMAEIFDFFAISRMLEKHRQSNLPAVRQGLSVFRHLRPFTPTP